jgi:hypothetical protein
VCRQNGIPVELVVGKPHMVNAQLSMQSAAGGQTA